MDDFHDYTPEARKIREELLKRGYGFKDDCVLGKEVHRAHSKSVWNILRAALEFDDKLKGLRKGQPVLDRSVSFSMGDIERIIGRTEGRIDQLRMHVEMIVGIFDHYEKSEFDYFSGREGGSPSLYGPRIYLREAVGISYKNLNLGEMPALAFGNSLTLFDISEPDVKVTDYSRQDNFSTPVDVFKSEVLGIDPAAMEEHLRQADQYTGRGRLVEGRNGTGLEKRTG